MHDFFCRAIILLSWPSVSYQPTAGPCHNQCFGRVARIPPEANASGKYLATRQDLSIKKGQDWGSPGAANIRLGVFSQLDYSCLPTNMAHAEAPTNAEMPVHPICWGIINGAALDTFWREFDRRNDLGHTSVLVRAGNRRKRQPCILSFRIDASERAVLDLQKAQQRLAQWSPAPPSRSGDAMGSFSLQHRIALPSQVHGQMHSSVVHHQPLESCPQGQRSQSAILLREEP